MRCFCHAVPIFTCINTNMMFFHFYFCRDKTIPFIYLIWKLLPSVFSKTFLQFFFCQIMFHFYDRDPGKVCFPFSFFLYGILPWNSLFLIFIQRSQCLGFIKHYQLSVHIGKCHLLWHWHLFRLSPIAVLVHDRKLFQYQLQFLINLWKLLLLCEEQLDECFFRKRIQFFFCISHLHNRDLPFLKIISIISENRTAGESPRLSFSSVSQCFFRLFLCLQAKKTDALLPKRNLRYLVKKEEQAAYI